MKRFFWSISLFFLVSYVSAATLENLYDATVTVESQSAADRELAFSLAFEQLLIKVTGQPDIVQTDSAKTLVSKAAGFVRSFRYAPIEQKTNNEVIVLWDKNNAVANVESDDLQPAEEAIKQYLIVSFDEKAVSNAMWQAKLPVWGKSRPTTLLWLAFQDSKQRLLLNANQQIELRTLLDQHSSKRGLPLIYPLVDEQDQANIKINDVWNGFNVPLEMASARYPAEIIVAARLLLNQDNHWQTVWRIYRDGESEFWQMNAPDLQQAVELGLDELTQRIAKLYASIPMAEDGTVFVHVEDVKSVVDYHRVSQYLSGLNAVTNAELVQTSPHEVIFRLDLRSDAKQLKQTIALGKTLVVSEDLDTDLQDARITYRLIQ